MVEISWLDVVKILIPILTVILAGLFALHRMKRNVQLEAKYKWKDEFRNRVIEFTKTAMGLNSRAVLFNMDNMEEDYKEAKDYIEWTHQLHKIYYSIDIMLNPNDLRTEVLNASYRSIIDNAFDELTNASKEDQNIVNFTDEFYEIAKEIYDDDKYIGSLI